MALKASDLGNDIAQIAEEHDQRATKDATLNMRINSAFLEEVKEAARLKGFPKYQAWVALVLQDAVNEAFGREVEIFE